MIRRYTMCEACFSKEAESERTRYVFRCSLTWRIASAGLAIWLEMFRSSFSSWTIATPVLYLSRHHLVESI